MSNGFFTCEVITTNVVHIGVLNELPDLRLLQVVEIVVVGGAEISAQASVVAGNDNTATTSLLVGVDAVLDAKASSVDSILHDGGVLVIASTAEVDDAVGGQDVLGTTGRVLGGTTSNQLGIEVVEQILVQREVLLLGQDGVICLESILVEKGLVANSLDICNEEK